MISRAINATLPVRRVFFPVMMILALAILICPPAFAQQKTSSSLPPEYNAGFAFFKYAKIRPPFEQWVKASRRYAEATPRDRVNMLRLEPALLDSRFDNYQPSENPFELRMRSRITLPSKKQAEKALKLDEKISLPLKISGQDEGFFPLQLADMWIALIPSNLDKMAELTLTKDQYPDFRKRFIDGGLANNTDAMLKVTFLPTGANTKEPLRMGGFDLWMLQVKIIRIEIWDHAGKQMVWVVEEAGHESAQQKHDIFNLYE